MTDSSAIRTGGSGRVLRRDAAENRERLVRAAWEVFAELGPEAGVEDIARRAGVGMGTLYRRFPTKEALVLALHEDLLDAMLDRTREILHADAEGDGRGEGLEAFLWYTGGLMASHHGCLSRLWRAAPPGTDGRRNDLWDMVSRLLARAQRTERVREDLTLTDVYLCVLSLRGLIEDTASQAPDGWRRQLSVILAGFRPAAGALEHRPADDSLVETGVPVAARPHPAANRGA
jgi:AcrR family transcriptional regulator